MEKNDVQETLLLFFNGHIFIHQNTIILQSERTEPHPETRRSSVNRVKLRQDETNSLVPHKLLMLYVDNKSVKT